MRYLVYGAGAIGGLLGALLHEAGHDVVLVARGDHLAAVRSRGLTVSTPTGSRTVPVPAVGDAHEADLAGPATVLLTVKSHQTVGALADLVGAVDPGTTVVGVQNGVANERTLLRYFAHVQAVCVMMPVTHLEPGVVEQHSLGVPGILDVGRFPGGYDDTSHGLAEAFGSAGFVSEPRADVMAWKHRKLVGNLSNAVDACCPEGPESDELAERARTEGESVLAAAGRTVVSREQDRVRRGDLLRRDHGGGRGGSSSWQSLRRATGSVESDFLNGEIVLLARLYDAQAPVNELLARTASRLARTGAPPASVPAVDLLAELAAT